MANEFLERGPNSWGTHVPDLPGCIAAGKTREETLTLIRAAINFHIEGLKEQAEEIPPPSPESFMVR